MSARKLGNWWWVDFRMSGRRYRVRCPENSEAGAKRYEAILRGRLTSGLPILPESPPLAPTFREFAQQWFDSYVVSNNKPSSRATKRGILDNHVLPFFGEARLGSINGAMAERFKAFKLSQGLSRKTVNLHLGVIAKCLRDAQDWGVSTSSPRIQWLKLPRAKFDFLTRPEARRLVDAMAVGRWQNMAVVGRWQAAHRSQMEQLGRPENHERHRPLVMAAQGRPRR